MKRTIICLAIMAVLAGGLYFFFSKDNSNVLSKQQALRKRQKNAFRMAQDGMSSAPEQKVAGSTHASDLSLIKSGTCTPIYDWPSKPRTW